MAQTLPSPDQHDGVRDERQPLLPQRPPSPRGYQSCPQGVTSPAPALRTRSPYLTASLRLHFLLGTVLLLPTIILLILLTINFFQPIPMLLPPHRSPAVLPFWLTIIAASILAPGLLFFELASQATRVCQLFVFCCSLIDFVLLVAVPELRATHSYLGLSAVFVSLAATAWSVVSSRHIQKQLVPFTINSDADSPLIVEIPLTRVQAKWTRRFKLIWAILGSFTVALLAFLVTIDLVLDAADSAFKPAGNLTLIHSTPLTTTPVNPQDPAEVNPYPVSFRLHLACENASAHLNTAKHNASLSPTALMMTDRGVSGVVGAQFLREMVSRAHTTSVGGEDGHFSLQSVCYWDRIGYGHSDFVDQPFSIQLHTNALFQALTRNGLVNEQKHQSGSSEQRQFIIVAIGYGHLFAQDFAVQHPELVHSFLHIDAETPSSWYTDRVSISSGARAGFLTHYHGRFGALINDLLPAVVEPLGLARLSGLFKGKTVVDRILSPGPRGSSAPGDLGGGGWRLESAGGSNSRALMSSWLERTDANLGVDSPNFKQLQRSNRAYHSLLSSRPVAVLSSFWRIHADLNGWAEEQRSLLIAPGEDSSNLVGWWRIGDRKKRSGGGDEGGPAGICSTATGVIFCQEAVRKLLAADQTRNGTSLQRYE